jgi:hypothetical protein
MTSGPARRSHEEFVRVLRRAGCSDEFISDVLSHLPDPIDLERDQQIRTRYGFERRATDGSHGRQPLTADWTVTRAGPPTTSWELRRQAEAASNSAESAIQITLLPIGGTSRVHWLVNIR